MAGALFRVSDIKQYFYCQRIVYFTYCQPVDKKTTFKMEYGQNIHDHLEGLEKRRTFIRYALDKGEKYFRYRLASERLGLSGIIDLLIKTDKVCLPVEFKNTAAKRVTKNHKYQLGGYACLIEDVMRVNVPFGFLYYIPEEQVIKRTLGDKIKSEVQAAIVGMRTLVSEAIMPEGTAQKGKCVDCEYLRYCGDRY